MSKLPTSKSSNKHVSKIIYLFLGSLLTLLTGCINIETDVTIYTDESWIGAMTVDIPAETVSLVGGVAAVEQRLNESKREAQDSGLPEEAFAWRQNRDGSMSMDVEGDGQGLEALNQAFFEGQADISINRQQEITIRHSYDQLGQVGSNVVKISGGEVINSNADKVQGNTAIWRNPQRIEVTLTGASTVSSWLWWGVIGGGLLGLCVCGFVMVTALVAGGVYWYRRRQY
jgi:hypothetical protein